MHQPSHGRCYSEFFTSGFRAMTERCPTNYTSTEISPPTSMRRNSRSISGWSPSIIMPSTRPSKASGPSRRSSILPRSPLFGRRRLSLPPKSLTFSTSPQSNTRGLYGDAGITEVWITAGGPYTPCRISKISEDNPQQYTDPFASSPNSKSFFTDVPGTSAPGSRKRESFLSLSSSHSFLPLPRLSCRSRPTSVQTVPSQPPPSSSPDCRPVSWVRSDRFFMSEEEESADITLVEDGGCNDSAENIDWRQFHIELLREEAASFF